MVDSCSMDNVFFLKSFVGVVQILIDSLVRVTKFPRLSCPDNSLQCGRSSRVTVTSERLISHIVWECLFEVGWDKATSLLINQRTYCASVQVMIQCGRTPGQFTLESQPPLRSNISPHVSARLPLFTWGQNNSGVLI